MIFNTHYYAGKKATAWIPITDLSVGDTVLVDESGTPAEYIIVQKGNPAANYNADGIWLLRKDISSMHSLTSTELQGWENSSLDTIPLNFFTQHFANYAATIFLNAMIPASQRSGSNMGDTTQYRWSFLLSSQEVGMTYTTNWKHPTDINSVKLSYFDSTNAASQKRVALYQGNASTWATRTYSSVDEQAPYAYDIESVTTTGARTLASSVGVSAGIRPTVVVSKSCMVTDDTHLLSFNL